MLDDEQEHTMSDANQRAREMQQQIEASRRAREAAQQAMAQRRVDKR